MLHISMPAEKVRLVCLQTDRFKTSSLVISAAVPLDENAAANALMLRLLKRGCKKYPDLTQFYGKLDELYGASVSSEISKNGDSQVLSLAVNCLDDRFALDGENIAEQCAELSAELFFAPNTKSGSFGSDVVAREKRLLAQLVEEEMNDKGDYARKRCINHMCTNEPYGRDECGTVEEIKAVKCADVYAAWKRMMSTAVFQITYVGSASHENIEKIFASRFAKIKREPVEINTIFFKRGGRFNRYEEQFPVNQGKLVIGMRTGMENSRDNLFAVMLANDIFGGGTYSKLFANVREKMSLAYYCRTRFIRSKGITLIESGIDVDKERTVSAAIVKQLADLRSGNTEPEVYEAAKLSMRERLTFSSPSSIAAWYSAQINEQEIITPEETAQGIDEVTPEQICEAAKKLSIDTIFMLTADGRETEDENQ